VDLTQAIYLTGVFDTKGPVRGALKDTVRHPVGPFGSLTFEIKSMADSCTSNFLISPIFSDIPHIQ
jgi:hypothetical protein